MISMLSGALAVRHNGSLMHLANKCGRRGTWMRDVPQIWRLDSSALLAMLLSEFTSRVDEFSANILHPPGRESENYRRKALGA